LARQHSSEDRRQCRCRHGNQRVSSHNSPSSAIVALPERCALSARRTAVSTGWPSLSLETQGRDGLKTVWVPTFRPYPGERRGQTKTAECWQGSANPLPGKQMVGPQRCKRLGRMPSLHKCMCVLERETGLEPAPLCRPPNRPHSPECALKKSSTAASASACFSM
jgi:hypothetical protein